MFICVVCCVCTCACVCVYVHMQVCSYSTVHGMASYKGGQVTKPKDLEINLKVHCTCVTQLSLVMKCLDGTP